MPKRKCVLQSKNWAKAKKYKNKTYNSFSAFNPDDLFWQFWKENKKAMMEAGYSIKKTENGWCVYLRK